MGLGKLRASEPASHASQARESCESCESSCEREPCETNVSSCLRMYTCQLFLRYKREIFIRGVLGFLKTTRSFPKIPEEVLSLPNKSEVFRRRPKSAEGEVIEKRLIHKIRDREEGIVIYSFYTRFSFLTWV